jgi:signal transduction histidine kinase/CheY-like chemotaxis protein
MSETTDILKTFNNNYKLYLNGIAPMIFMNNFLERCTKIIGFNAGFIVSSQINDETKFITFEAIYNSRELLRDDVVFTENTKYEVTTDDSNCIESLNTSKQIVLLNKICDAPKYLDNITSCFKRTISSESFETPIDFMFDISKFRIMIYTPILAHGKIIGILGLGSKENKIISGSIEKIKMVGKQDLDTLATIDINVFNVTANYCGILMSGYNTVKYNTIEIDRNFITYQLTEQILNAINDGLIVTDKCFNIIYINECAKSLIKTVYNTFKTDFLDKNLLKIFPQLRILKPDSSGDDVILKNRKVELSIRNKNNVNSIEFVFNTVSCNGSFYHVSAVHNKDAENTSSPKNDKLISTHKNLIAYLSHELRNPLQTISLANYLVQSFIKSTDIPTKIKGSFESINKACLDMKRIINDILDFSKLDANEFVINMELVNICDMIDELVEDYAIKASNKGLSLLYDISDDVPKTLYTDVTRMNQILGNLISNSIKYSDQGTISLNVTYDEDTHGVIFSIIDEGIGIRDDEIGRLFKDYGQTSNSFKFNIDSNGLGLCISQKIANLLGGYITVKSEYKKGSQFIMFHPIKLGTSGMIYDKKILSMNLVGNVLIVDDNEANSVLFKLLLENFNCEYDGTLTMESVNDGKNAIEVCKINKYDIIFMDINMPGIDGCTASKIIRKNGYTGIIIATTGNIMAKLENRNMIDKERYKCFDDIIIKPFDDTTILNILKKYLEIKSL